MQRAELRMSDDPLFDRASSMQVDHLAYTRDGPRPNDYAIDPDNTQGLFEEQLARGITGCRS